MQKAKIITVKNVDIDRFMGNWFVLAGRFTFLEVDVHNGVESYAWNEEKKRIDITFTYNKGSFDGAQKSISQKAWIFNQQSKAHWKISPLWPIKLDYLIVDLDEKYNWVAIGVPDQKYLWIMARDWTKPDAIIKIVKARLQKIGYNSLIVTKVPHRWG